VRGIGRFVKDGAIWLRPRAGLARLEDRAAMARSPEPILNVDRQGGVLVHPEGGPTRAAFDIMMLLA
jgi:hypothetical protein